MGAGQTITVYVAKGIKIQKTVWFLHKTQDIGYLGISNIFGATILGVVLCTTSIMLFSIVSVVREKR